jgi:hypothetical protein
MDMEQRSIVLAKSGKVAAVAVLITAAFLFISGTLAFPQNKSAEKQESAGDLLRKAVAGELKATKRKRRIPQKSRSSGSSRPAQETSIACGR